MKNSRIDDPFTFPACNRDPTSGEGDTLIGTPGPSSHSQAKTSATVVFERLRHSTVMEMTGSPPAKRSSSGYLHTQCAERSPFKGRTQSLCLYLIALSGILEVRLLVPKMRLMSTSAALIFFWTVENHYSSSPWGEVHCGYQTRTSRKRSRGMSHLSAVLTVQAGSAREDLNVVKSLHHL